MSTNDERMLSMLIFVSSLFTTVVGPLLIWLLKKDSSAYVDYYGKEYFNFLISYTVYGFAASLLIVVLIGFVLLPVVGLMYFIFTIVAAIKAYNGEMYRIPLIFRLIK
ncbi:membrane protein [Weizmannia acidilactici]|uniref:Membrane protein n=1 Tax=Weizmannia acidilactici TaxID=2607726 RepID=A0A5J4J851_9BACI|nr:DUF4870 domain-containing protein [Weizmannia acidilactici]GER68234.1 membrane protein [Weizmannia acidilactici]GER71072.1 membrane protein [Weizmannia acidilactici]GER74545.1 membrane protein [Weizmannia acidilactici]